MIRGLCIIAWVILVSVILWRVFGKKLANYLEGEYTEEVNETNELLNGPVEEEDPEKTLARQSLQDKIEELKASADKLTASTEELKISKMLEEVNKQLAEKHKELEELDTKEWIKQ